MFSSIVFLTCLTFVAAGLYPNKWDCKTGLDSQYVKCLHYAYDYDYEKKHLCQQCLGDCLIRNSDRDPCAGRRHYYRNHKPHPSGDCSRFIQCSNLGSVVKNCPYPLNFWPRIQVCAWNYQYACPKSHYYTDSYDVTYHYNYCDKIEIQRTGTLLYAELTHVKGHIYCGAGYQKKTGNHWGCYKSDDESTNKLLSVYITHIDYETHIETQIYPDPAKYYDPFYNYYDYTIYSERLTYFDEPKSKRVNVKQGDYLKIYHGDYYKGHSKQLSGSHEIKLYLAYQKDYYY